jgi:hypothetical protein
VKFGQSEKWKAPPFFSLSRVGLIKLDEDEDDDEGEEDEEEEDGDEDEDARGFLPAFSSPDAELLLELLLLGRGVVIAT